MVETPAVPDLPALLVVAAGRGSRSGQDRPKQYVRLDGETVLARTIRALAAGLPEAPILCVIHPDDRPAYEAATGDLPIAIRTQLRQPVPGGDTRQASVRAGLEALAREQNAPSVVLIHDAARPFVSPDLVRTIARAAAGGGAIPGTPVTDTIKTVDGDGRVVDTPDRSGLRAVQTPQGFVFSALLAAHRHAAEAGRHDLTDDAAVMEWAGHAVRVVAGEHGNIKLTTPDDFARLAALRPMVSRTGFGYDVHALGPGDHVMLCGVAVPHDRGLIGHSDADVALHALTDAVFGALADGDIGSHFPPSDMRWKGAASDQFLAHALERLRARGGRLDHADITMVCETPKIGPHRDAMRARVAAICGVPVGRVAVKATTSEKLGFTGRGEGIAAHAVATIRLPEDADG